MKCPGQDMQYWKPGAIFDAPCPECGKPVEFFKDDASRKCSCGHRFVNPKMDFGCASYCPYAEQCLGTLPPEAVAQREDLLKDRVAVEVKRWLRQDFRRIGRAARTAKFAEMIGRNERAHLAVVLCAAYLHEVDPADARAILEKLGANELLVETVSRLIDRTMESDKIPFTNEDSLEMRVVHDAKALAQLEERQKHDPEAPAELDAFLTESGRAEARRIAAAAG